MTDRKPYDASRRRFCAALYRQGFKRGDKTAPIMFEKVEHFNEPRQEGQAVILTTRLLVVELWRDGDHYVSHYVNRNGAWAKLTAPVPFRTVEGMYAALKHERTRTDHKELA